MRPHLFFIALSALAGVLVAHSAPAQTDAAQTEGGNLAGSIDTFLGQVHTATHPLEGDGSYFVGQGQSYNVDPRLVVAISGAETSFGVHVCGTDNAFNWFWNGTCANSPFTSWDDGIHTVSHFLDKSYILHGYNTIPLIAKKYCTSGCQNWIPNVTSFYRQMGGDPNGELAWNGSGMGSAIGATTGGTPSASTGTGTESGAGEEPAAIGSLTATVVHSVTSGFWPMPDRTVTVTIAATAHDVAELQLGTATLVRDDGTAVAMLRRIANSPATATSPSEPQYQVTATMPLSAYDPSRLYVQLTAKLHRVPVATIVSATLAPVAAPATTATGSHWPVWIAVGFGVLLLLGGIAIAAVKFVPKMKFAPKGISTPAKPKLPATAVAATIAPQREALPAVTPAVTQVVTPVVPPVVAPTVPAALDSAAAQDATAKNAAQWANQVPATQWTGIDPMIAATQAAAKDGAGTASPSNNGAVGQ